MQTNSNNITADGEYIPEKQLNTGFKIPKKPDAEQVESVQNYFNFPQTQVYDNSYFKYDSSTESYDPQTVFYSNLIYNQILTEIHKEKPKKYDDSNILKKTIPDIDDPTLPLELKSLFQPLYCKLCAAHLSSNVNAKLHYNSKNHEKKIRRYLIDYSERTGEPLHKRARIEEKPSKVNKTVEEYNPRYYHCDICDLPLTGKAHAESHYMGRNHQKVLMGQKNPAGRGYYNQDGKWVREHKTAKVANGQDNIGVDFRYPNTPTATVTSKQQNTFRCELCSISTTCQEQLESHYKGHKHQKKLKQWQKMMNVNYAAYAPVVAQQTYTQQTYTQQSTVTIVPPIVCIEPPPPPPPVKLDVSVYRTPSGSYYCPICNISVNTEAQFRQHFESKSHLKKAATPTTTSTTTATTTTILK